jgi:hypothetical protein
VGSRHRCRDDLVAAGMPWSSVEATLRAAAPGNEAEDSARVMHVTTTESFAADPVDADKAGTQAILDNSLTAWIASLKQRAESQPAQ